MPQPPSPPPAAPTAPRVTVIVPCRNEARYIGPCLDSILASAYPADAIEVLVVDGHSSDKTRTIVADYSAKHPQIRLLDNPKRIVPTALNLGIRAASGDVIVRMDAHVVYPPEYIPRLVAALAETGADNVGGCMITLPADGTAVSQAIAIALAHPFGVGNSAFRIGARAARTVDTVPFGCFPRSVFQRVGLFDEQMIRNQDDEFNNRILRRGGKIVLLPDIVCYYYARGSFSQVGRMFYQYGAFKPLVARKTGRFMTLRQLVPAAFVGGLGAAVLTALIWPPALVLGAAIVAAYACSVLFCAARVARSHGIRCAVAIAAAFPVVHFSYGSGFLRGLWSGLIGRRTPWRDPATVPLSR
jgi:glycosyltransferase involved in cell wall biosynthesis